MESHSKFANDELNRQVSEGRQRLGLKRPSSRFQGRDKRPNKGAPRSSTPNGHEALLSALRGKLITLVTIKGAHLEGELIDYDKYTMTIVDKGGLQPPVCVFKHAVEFFSEVK